MKTETDNNFFEEVYDENKRIFFKCILCDVICYTHETLNKHNESKKHINKVKNVNSINESILKCTICNITCNTQDQFEIHKKGKQHMKKMKSHGEDLKSSDSDSMTKFSFKDESSSNTDIIEVFDNVKPVLKTEIKSDYRLDDWNIGDKSEKVLEKSLSNPGSTLVNILLIPIKEKNRITCQLCNQSMDTEDMYRIHCNAANHQKKLAILRVKDRHVPKIENEDFVFCSACEISLHKNNADSHYAGRLHKEKLIKSKQEIGSDEINIKKYFSSESINFESLKFDPRNYQVEVYRKALRQDSVVFLPTGTGKTFIGAMIIVKMLKENPFLRVAFLVDKVILVMQQVEFFKQQFENISLTRFTSNKENMVRTLKLIGLANDYINTDYNCSVRDHDVVVATADLFRNCLDRHQLFWKDFCLVILDEAHHCVKDHPFKKLLRDYHLYPQDILINDSNSMAIDIYNEKPNVDEKKLSLWKSKRCQIVGLTASPSGDVDLDVTYKLLVTLLESLGDVEIVSVTDNIDELNQYTSLTNIETKIVNYSKKENEFRKLVSQSFMFLVKKFERNMKNIGNDFSPTQSGDLSIEDIANLKSRLCGLKDEFKEIENTILNHILSLLSIIETIDSMGFQSAQNKFRKLLDNEGNMVWFSNNIFKFENNCEKMLQSNSETDESEKSTMVFSLLEEFNLDDDSNRTILVIVKERKIVNKLEKVLKQHLRDSKYSVVKLVGHGTGNVKCKGMSVKKQKSALNFIRKLKNQVIIATSVADEGIDLPECDLVIIINPPNSVQALIQIRGRARKKEGRLLVICRDQESVNSLQQLKIKECNINKSIEMLSKLKLSKVV